MASKLQNRGGAKAVWAVTDQPPVVAATVPNKKKGGTLSLVHFTETDIEKESQSLARERSMASKLQNRGGAKAVWAVTDQPPVVAATVPNKKKGGTLSLVHFTETESQSLARERSMASKLQNRGGAKAVWAVTDQPPVVAVTDQPPVVAATVPNKKKGGTLSLVPAKRRLVKTMVFLSIIEFVGSNFCASGATQTNSANSTSKIPSASNSKQIIPEPDGLTSQKP